MTQKMKRAVVLALLLLLIGGALLASIGLPGPIFPRDDIFGDLERELADQIAATHLNGNTVVDLQKGLSKILHEGMPAEAAKAILTAAGFKLYPQRREYVPSELDSSIEGLKVSIVRHTWFSYYTIVVRLDIKQGSVRSVGAAAFPRAL